MNYLTYDNNTVIWFWFTFYTLTILFLIPLPQQAKNLLASAEKTNQQAIQLASGLVLRTVLIVPMLLLLKNAI